MFYAGYIVDAVWLSSTALQIFLLTWTMRKKLLGTCPIFFYYLIFEVAETAVLYPMWKYAGIYYYSHWIGKSLWYAYNFTVQIGHLIETVFFIAILYQLYSHLFRNYPGFSALQDKLFRWAAGTSIVISAVVAIMVPTNPEDSRLMIGVLTFSLAAGVVKAGIVFFALVISSVLALRWNHYAFGILAGTGFFATVELASVASRLYGGWTAHANFSLVKSAAYAFAMLIWVLFYVREPKTVSANFVPENDLTSWNQALVEMLTR